MADKISETYSYQAQVGKQSLTSYKNALDMYNAGVNQAIKLDNDLPIFVDTNVLLRVYKISFKAREKLVKFFNDYNKRIYITSQVQKEFIKNREDVISTFFNNVTNELPQSFQKNIQNKIDSFLNDNKIILKDYEHIETELQKIKTKTTELFNKLNKDVEEKEKEKNKIIFFDSMLDILNSAHILPPLSEEEQVVIKKHYDILKKDINVEKLDSFIEKPGVAFPGLGDLKRKPSEPYGDYIIYHEMLSFVSTTKSSAIFLTYDSTKGDWMQKDRLPHLHYIENFYLNTGQVIFILDAERVFEDLLDISFKSLIADPVPEIAPLLDLITSENLETFLDSYDDTKSALKPDDETLDGFVTELYRNNFSTLKDLKNGLDSAKANNNFYKAKHLNQVGRARLSLAKNYEYYRRYVEGNPEPENVIYLGKSEF